MTAKSGFQYEIIGPERATDGASVPERREDLEGAAQDFLAGAPLIQISGYLVEAGRSVLSAAVTVAGSSYETTPTVVFTTQGVVIAATVTNGGSSYETAPTVVFSSGAAAGTAVVGGGVVQYIIITNPGAYTQAQADGLTISFTGGGGTGAAATAVFDGLSATGAAATAVMVANAVSSLTITAGGTGYVIAPLITFTGGGGADAEATASIAPTSVYGFACDDAHDTTSNGEKSIGHHRVFSTWEFSGTLSTTNLNRVTDRYATVGLVRDPLTKRWYLDAAGDEFNVSNIPSIWNTGDSYPVVNFTPKASVIV